MKFKYKINGGEIGRQATKTQKRVAKKISHKSFRKISKAAIKSGNADLAPKWGKFHGWVD